MFISMELLGYQTYEILGFQKNNVVSYHTCIGFISPIEEEKGLHHGQYGDRTHDIRVISTTL